MSWSARLLIGLVLLLGGAGAMAWALAHYPPMARVLGVVAPPPVSRPAPIALRSAPASPRAAETPATTEREIASVEARVARVEDLSQHAAGSAIP